MSDDDKPNKKPIMVAELNANADPDARLKLLLARGHITKDEADAQRKARAARQALLDADHAARLARG